jgi:hypothetical protein
MDKQEARPRNRRSNTPPALEEVLEYAEIRAKKDGVSPEYYMDQAESAFEFYSSNMEVCCARTWKDGSGRTVLNWKLKLVNNWFK